MSTNMSCVAQGYKNQDFIETARRLVSALEKLPAQYMSGELSDATKRMREAVDSSKIERIAAHSQRLIRDVKGHPKEYITREIVDTAARLERLLPAYAGS